jgi:hypothetical protein
MASNLITVTVDYAGTQRIGGVVWGIDLNNIAGPIRANGIGGDSRIRYKESRALNFNETESNDIRNYDVQESLSAIAGAGEFLSELTVIRFGVNAKIGTLLPAPESMVFLLPRISGAIKPTPAGGASFYFHELGNPDPVYYEVQESVATIIGSVPAGNISGSVSAPFIPYASAANTLSDSWLYRTAGGIAISAKKIITSYVPNKSRIDFGASGDIININNDGNGYGYSWYYGDTVSNSNGFEGNEVEFTTDYSRMLGLLPSFTGNIIIVKDANLAPFLTSDVIALTELQILLQHNLSVLLNGQNSSLSLDGTQSLLSHNTQAYIQAPITLFYAAGIIQSSTNLTTISWGAGGDNFTVTTDNGVFGESYLNLTTTVATFGNSVGTLGFGPAVATLSHSIEIDVNTPLFNLSGCVLVRMSLTPYANDAAAGVGGLVTGDLYQETATGHVMIKQ